MLFLIQGSVEISHYMGRRKSEPVIRIVEAGHELDAEAKFINHFENKTVEYATYYSVRIDEVNEAIL